MAKKGNIASIERGITQMIHDTTNKLNDITNVDWEHMNVTAGTLKLWSAHEVIYKVMLRL